MSRFFRCTSNPSGPLLKLDTDWEAKEMARHVDYHEVDADGLPVIPAEELEAEQAK
jgi:hypothetical protein